MPLFEFFLGSLICAGVGCGNCDAAEGGSFARWPTPARFVASAAYLSAYCRQPCLFLRHIGLALSEKRHLSRLYTPATSLGHPCLCPSGGTGEARGTPRKQAAGWPKRHSYLRKQPQTNSRRTSRSPPGAFTSAWLWIGGNGLARAAPARILRLVRRTLPVSMRSCAKSIDTKRWLARSTGVRGGTSLRSTAAETTGLLLDGNVYHQIARRQAEVLGRQTHLCAC